MQKNQFFKIQDFAPKSLPVSGLKWEKKKKKPPTTRQSTAKLSHITKVQGRLEPALANGERLRVLNAMFYPLGHGWL